VRQLSNLASHCPRPPPSVLWSDLVPFSLSTSE
jgi:hypothetical protein